MMDDDEMYQLKASLHAALVEHGRTASDANEIVDIAEHAAREAIQRLIEIVGTVSENNRDAAIILALNIMERLALPEKR